MHLSYPKISNSVFFHILSSLGLTIGSSSDGCQIAVFESSLCLKECMLSSSVMTSNFLTCRNFLGFESLDSSDISVSAWWIPDLGLKLQLWLPASALWCYSFTTEHCQKPIEPLWLRTLEWLELDDLCHSVTLILRNTQFHFSKRKSVFVSRIKYYYDPLLLLVFLLTNLENNYICIYDYLLYIKALIYYLKCIILKLRVLFI